MKPSFLVMVQQKYCVILDHVNSYMSVCVVTSMDKFKSWNNPAVTVVSVLQEAKSRDHVFTKIVISLEQIYYM